MAKKEEMVHAILLEAAMRREYLSNATVESVYFGGGTPSILEIHELRLMLDEIHRNYTISTSAEITIEANPDDLSGEYLEELVALGFNRISIGVQSFHDDELLLLNRRHNSLQAIMAIERARKSGFRNISIDLIYGLPGSGEESWRYSIEKATEADIQHISAYHLSIEPGTVFYRRKIKGLIGDVDEHLSERQYQVMTDICKRHGFVHYEISSFGKQGYFSGHNTGYWTGKKYLGLGPSAHSYNGFSRQWNISNNREYVQGIRDGRPATAGETLTFRTRFNEYMLTSLRTMWGADLDYINRKFGREYYKKTIEVLEKYLSTGKLIASGNNIRLSEAGMFISDGIIADFLVIADGAKD